MKVHTFQIMLEGLIKAWWPWVNLSLEKHQSRATALLNYWVLSYSQVSFRLCTMIHTYCRLLHQSLSILVIVTSPLHFLSIYLSFDYLTIWIQRLLRFSLIIIRKYNPPGGVVLVWLPLIWHRTYRRLGQIEVQPMLLCFLHLKAVQPLKLTLIIQHAFLMTINGCHRFPLLHPWGYALR